MSKFPLMRKIAFCLGLIIIHLSLTGIKVKGIAASSAGFSDLNLLIITIDTLRADHLGIYGYDKIKTPHIDNLGEKGVLFSHAYCHVPLTLPSHCSLFTGTLPLFHGVRDNGYRLPSFNLTLAEIFKKKGYQTAAFVGAFPLDSRFGLDKGFEVYDDLYGSKNVVRDLSFIERRAEEVNRKVFAWLDNNHDKKFFIWIHYFDPHAPYEPPPLYKDEYNGREYDGEIAYTDSVIGELLARLNQLKLTEKTLIILTSDHGEGLGDHNETTHGIFVYDSTLRVPLIFNNPKLLPQGQIIADQVVLIDLMPTILDLMGLSQSPNVQGKSLRSKILKDKPFSKKYCYIESVAALMDRNWAPLQGVRTKEWKYIDAPIPELYDLKKDPEEMNNVIEDNLKIAQRLRKRLQDMISRNSSPLSSRVLKTEREKGTIEKLRALGYITGRTVKSETERPDPKTMIEVDNLFNEAIIASETGKLEIARQLYEKTLQKQPNFIIGYEYAAYNYYKMGSLNEAVSLLEKAVQLNLTNHSLLARLGLYYQEAKRLEESIEILKDLVQQVDDYAEAHNYLGVSYFKSGQLIKAIDSFKKAVSLDNNYAMAMNNLGNCYLAQKEYNLAEQEYQKAISVDDHLASAYNGLGVVYYRQGLVEKTLLYWEESLKIDPRQADTLYNLGRVYLRLGRKQKSLHFFKLFIQNASPHKYSRDLDEVKEVIKRLKKELQSALE